MNNKGSHAISSRYSHVMELLNCSKAWLSFITTLIFKFRRKKYSKPASEYLSFACLASDGLRATVPVGEECVITLNCSEAGMGNITCRIHSNTGSDVDIDIVDNGDGTISIIYTPNVQGAYTINIKFGGQPVPEGQFTQQVKRLVQLCDSFSGVIDWLNAMSLLCLHDLGKRKIILFSIRFYIYVF